jgi:hypothetical protein
MNITWKLESRSLKDLKDYSKNPRILTKDQETQLLESLNKYGLIDKPIINTDNTLIGGHQRKRVLKKLGYKQVECWIPSRTLEEKEIEELNIRLNKNTGDWDWDILANEWEFEDLLNWGFTPEELLQDEGDTEIIDEISLPDGEKGLAQMTFTLSTEQVEKLEQAIKLSKSMGPLEDSENQNSNGNALARIAEIFITQNDKH